MATLSIEEQVRMARRALDATVRALREVPHRFDREMATERLRTISESLLCVLETNPRHAAHYDAAFTALQQTEELIAALRQLPVAESPAAHSAMALLSNVFEALTPVGHELSALLVQHKESLRRKDDALSVRPFRASVGLPELHAFRRSRLLPPLDISPALDVEATEPQPLSLPGSIEALLAMAEAMANGDPHDSPSEPPPELPARELREGLAYAPAILERQMMRDLAHDALEDIAGFRNLRKPIPTETWLDQAPFEQRLLNQIDYFVSLGFFALQQVSIFHAGSEAPDPDRAFAVALALNCVEGVDTAQTSVAVLCESPPEEMPGFIEGFSLAPNPHIVPALTELLYLERPPLTCVALRVLSRQGHLSDTDLRNTFDRGERSVRLEVANALTHVGSDELVRALLDGMLRQGDDDALFEAAARTMVLRGDRFAGDVLRPALQASPSEVRREAAFELLALIGTSSDAELLLNALDDSVTVRRLRALGRFGRPIVFARLLAQLDGDDEELSEAAAEALMRITGAPELWAEGEVPWVEEMPPEAYDLDVPIPTRKVRVVIRERPLWEQWLQDRNSRFEPERRYRGGVDFSPTQIVDELEAPGTPAERRIEAAEELQLALGTPVRFFCDDWVINQRSRLEQLRAELALQSNATSGYPNLPSPMAAVGSKQRWSA